MKRFYKNIFALLLTIALILPLTACKPQSQDDKILGIKIEDDTPYSSETLAFAEQTIFSLVKYTYKSAFLDNVTEKMEKRLADYSHRICNITAITPVTEQQYRFAIECLKYRGEDAIDELISFQKGESSDCETARLLYLDLSYVFGSDHVASMLYDCCLLIYDIRYERTLEKLETYQYPWYQEELNSLAAEKEILTNSIGREDFSALIKCSTAIAELLSVEPNKISNTFSDAELLDMICYLDLSAINIEASGWKLLLSYSLNVKTSSYHNALYNEFIDSGDIDRVAALMNDSINLLILAMDGLTPSDIGLLRSGNHEELTTIIFSRFNEKNWETFEAVTSVSLSNNKYSALAKAEYGVAYSEYLSAIRPTNVCELRTKINDSNFYSYLSDYIKGICPAISYEVKA